MSYEERDGEINGMLVGTDYMVVDRLMNYAHIVIANMLVKDLHMVDEEDSRMVVELDSQLAEKHEEDLQQMV